MWDTKHRFKREFQISVLCVSCCVRLGKTDKIMRWFWFHWMKFYRKISPQFSFLASFHEMKKFMTWYSSILGLKANNVQYFWSDNSNDNVWNFFFVWVFITSNFHQKRTNTSWIFATIMSLKVKLEENSKQNDFFVVVRLTWFNEQTLNVNWISNQLFIYILWSCSEMNSHALVITRKKTLHLSRMTWWGNNVKRNIKRIKKM